VSDDIDTAAPVPSSPGSEDDLVVESTDPASTSAPPVRGGRDHVSSVATVLAFALIFTVYSFWLGSDFLDVQGRMFDISRSVPQLILSVGLVVCLACHQFDLSVASIATLSAFLTLGLYLRTDWPMGLAIAVAILVGAVAGLVNGLLVTRLRLNAFIATLGTGGVYAGFTVVYSKGSIVGPTTATGPLPSWFSGGGSLGDFQQKVPFVVGVLVVVAIVLALLVSFDQRFPPQRAPMWRRLVLAGLGIAVVVASVVSDVVATLNWTTTVLMVLALAVWIMLKYTSTGQSMYATGGSVRAASFAGIRTDVITIAAFVISGVMAATAGVLLAASQGSAVPGIADPLLLPAYAAVFLSTVLVSRGRFHVWGAVGGGIALVYVSSGLVEGGVPFTWTQVINGTVLVLAVSLSTFLRRTGRT
jgi:ribose/xylose/arabinose/galactoside ABC-type transport system permease subunit